MVNKKKMATKKKRPSALGYKACSNRGSKLRSNPSSRAGAQLVECRIVNERTGTKPVSKTTAKRKTTAKKTTAKRGGKGGQMKIF